MSDWKVIEKRRDTLTDTAMNVATLGVYGLAGQEKCIYVVEQEKTKETKTVRASDAYEVGDRISEDEFEEEE